MTILSKYLCPFKFTCYNSDFHNFLERSDKWAQLKKIIREIKTKSTNSFDDSNSLRSKRFRGVSEQKKSEQKSLKNGIFEVLAARKMGREQKRDPFFARPKHRKSHSSDFVCSETPRKRLLRRL